MSESIKTQPMEVMKGRRSLALPASVAYQYIALAAVILFGAAMRFYKLGEWSFWIDEAITMTYVRDGALVPSLFYPTSFRFISITLDLFGLSDWSARLAPVLIGLITLPALFFLVRRVYGGWAGVLAVVLVAISPWHLHWSQNARFYTAFLLFYTLAFFAFYWWLETDRFRYLALAGLFLVLSMLERMMTLFIVPVIGAYLLALMALPFEKPAGLNRRNLILLATPVVLAGVYLVFGMGLLGDFSQNILGHEHNPIRVGLSVVYDVGLPLFIIGLLGGGYLVFKKDRLGLFLLLNALIPTLLLVLMAPFTQAFSRYIFMVLPSWAILGAVAAKDLLVQARGQGRLLALGVLLVLLADPISQDVLYYQFQNGNRPDWKGAFNLVVERQLPGDDLATTRPLLAEYYLGVEAIDTNRIDLDGIERAGERTWFVIDNRTFVSAELQGWLDQKAELIGIRDVNLPGKTMMMRIYLFHPEDR